MFLHTFIYFLHAKALWPYCMSIWVIWTSMFLLRKKITEFQNVTARRDYLLFSPHLKDKPMKVWAELLENQVLKSHTSWDVVQLISFYLYISTGWTHTDIWLYISHSTNLNKCTWQKCYHSITSWMYRWFVQGDYSQCLF